MPVSLFGTPKYVGIDIGSHTIKAVQIEQRGAIAKITRIGSIPTPIDTVREGVVIDKESVGLAIRNLLNNYRINANTANIAVAGGSVVVRSVRLPKMSEAALRKSIKYEAGRYIPSSVEDSYVEFEILGNSADNQMDVLIVAAPKDIVESRVSACSVAGLDIELVDIEAFSTYRSVIEQGSQPDMINSTIAMIEVGSTNTHVSVVTNGRFALTRTIPIAGDTLTQALKSYLKSTMEEAEETKKNIDMSPLAHANPGPMENAPLRLIQPIVDEMLREIRRSLNYYQSQVSDGEPAGPVTQVIGTGGTMQMAGLAEYLSFKLSLPVTKATIFDNPNNDFTSVMDSEGFNDKLCYGVAFGLSSRKVIRATAAA